MFHRYYIFVPPGDLNLVGTFCKWFLLFAVYFMLVGFKLGEQFFGDPGVDLVVGGGSPYGRIVSDDIHEIIIYRRMRYDDKFGG